MSLIRLAVVCGGIGVGTVTLIPHATHSWALAKADPLAVRTEEMARGMNTLAGRQIGSTELQGVHAEGHMLVMQLRTQQASIGPLSDVDVSKMLSAMWCMKPEVADYVSRGGDIRVEVTTADGHMTPAMITTCAGTSVYPGA
jgi:hypothetical protein